MSVFTVGKYGKELEMDGVTKDGLKEISKELFTMANLKTGNFPESGF